MNEKPKGMVSESTLNVKEAAEKERAKMNSDENYVPTMEVLELFKVEKLHDIAVSLAELVDIFKAAKGMPKSEVKSSAPVAKPVEAPKPVAPSAPAPVAQPSAPVDTRLAEVQEKLKDYINLLNIDTDSDTMFIILRPKQFLGGQNFAGIAGIVQKELGGEYVSQGKGSHFRVPKVKQ